jgi:hypothetical protein
MAAFWSARGPRKGLTRFFLTGLVDEGKDLPPVIPPLES